MACTSCAKQFGFFTKEHGCPVCKFSFCNACLKHRLVRDGKKLTVCLRCAKLSSMTSDDSRQQNLAQAASVKPSLSIIQASVAKVPIVTGATDESQTNEEETIRSRLATLRTVQEDEASSAGPSHPTGILGPQDTIDIEKRLAALKGTTYKDAAMRNAEAKRMMAPDQRTEEQKVQDLIGQYVAETKIDEVTESRTAEQDEEIVRRLNALKEIVPPMEAPARSDDTDSDTDSMKDEKLARKLAQQYAEEARIHRRARMDSSSSESIPDDSEGPLPWCTICNEDAVLQCKGCDGDLYCTSCYDEFHYDDRGEHPTVPFRKKRQVKAK
ncbi:abscission/NoCut checkpoint regulator-like [Anopheles albimanus]|uniref:FYVE-type domain-containing protein n=1 Tax=Anopheles albimanus TaxID=7167 RepID=A0A8W7JXF4_ANOAL|nr:abscission/NoCut checkpoint regulator-like [Anopheles albimanus]